MLLPHLLELVQRWSKKEKAYIEVDHPEAIKFYNDFMGGVDLMDRLIAYYQTKRLPTRLILHLLSLSIANSWIGYREGERKKYMKRNQILYLLAFREETAQVLCKTELNPTCFRGRPSFWSILNYYPVPEKKTWPAIRRIFEVRYDGFDHWPEVAQISSLPSAARWNIASKVYKMQHLPVFDWLLQLQFSWTNFLHSFFLLEIWMIYRSVVYYYLYNNYWQINLGVICAIVWKAQLGSSWGAS